MSQALLIFCITIFSIILVKSPRPHPPPDTCHYDPKTIHNAPSLKCTEYNQEKVTSTTKYICTVPLHDKCPDIHAAQPPDSPYHTFLHVVEPHVDRNRFPNLKLNQKCQYSRFCQELTKALCLPTFGHGFEVQKLRPLNTGINELDLTLLAYTIYPKGLTDYTYMLPRDKESPKPEQNPNDIQYHVGWRKDTFVIYFDGTEFGKEREDVDIDLRVGHAEKTLTLQGRATTIRVHEGIANRLEQESFWHSFSRILDATYEHYKHYADESARKARGRPGMMRQGQWENMPESDRLKRLVISGHSLGGGYALWFYLMVFGDNDPNNPWRRKMGDMFKDMTLYDITVMTYGAPFIIYYQDVLKIPMHVAERVFSFVDYDDPVPKSLAGAGSAIPLVKDEKGENLKIKMKKSSLLLLGRNAGVGTYFIIYHTKKSVWFERRDPWSPSIQFGSLCWWLVKLKDTKMPLLQSARAAWNNHMEGVYRERILLSLVNIMKSSDALEKEIPYFKYLLDAPAVAQDDEVSLKGKQLWEKQTQEFRDLWPKLERKATKMFRKRVQKLERLTEKTKELVKKGHDTVNERWH